MDPPATVSGTSRWIGAAAVVTTAIVAGAVAARAIVAPEPCVPAVGSRSIVLILTDDQRWDTISAMPNVRRHLADRGVTFTDAFVSDPLCCPSRASILTGRYAHDHQVWLNGPPLGGFARFRDDSTVATWLQGAGFRTALFGKYLNGYQGTYVPPGWDRWAAIAAYRSPFDLYYRYALNVDGHLEVHGGMPEDYSTNVLADKAVDFICHTGGSLFVSFDPVAPHAPLWAAPGDRYQGPLPPLPGSFDEADVSDKPAWVRGLPRLGPTGRAHVENIRRAALGTLPAVDRAVGRIVDALTRTGRIHDTLLVFTSDNGFSWGEHRWVDKVAPYEESIRVPFVVRYDPVVADPGRTDGHLVQNIDLAPTFASLAGVAAPGSEGADLLPLLGSVSVPWRSDVLIEAAELAGVPSYCGLRTSDAKYVRYATDEEELYDLAGDPLELDNLAADAASQDELTTFRNRLRELCDPPPPGMSLPAG